MSVDPRQATEQALVAEIKDMSDNQLLDRAAHYNARLREGWKLQAQAKLLLDANINLFTICQNEIHHRMSKRLEQATDRELGRCGN